MGGGSKIRFRRISGAVICLAMTIPRIYSLILVREVKISDAVINEEYSNINWDFSFCRNLNNRESDQLGNLLEVLGNFSPRHSQCDKRVWKCDPYCFSCNSYFLSLVIDPKLSPFEPYKFIWRSCAPVRIKVFAWLFYHRRLNTPFVSQLVCNVQVKL